MKPALSKGELDYVNASVQNGVRLDTRQPGEPRELHLLKCASGYSDGCVRARRGFSEVEVSVYLRESERLLHSMKLLAEDDAGRKHEAALFHCGVTLAPGIGVFFERFYAEYMFGVDVRVRIIENDGGITPLTLAALSLIFSDISVPVFENMHRYAESSAEVVLPACESFALVGGNALRDPTAMEEGASKAVFRVFGSGGNVWSVFAADISSLLFQDVVEFVLSIESQGWA